MKLILTLSTILALCLFTSCDKKGEVAHYEVEKSTSTKPTKQPGAGMKTSSQPAPKSTYSWTLPKGWTDQPASGMRLGTITIPNGDSTLSAGIFEFGGGLVGNINRRRGQIGLPPLAPEMVPPTLTEFNSPLGKDGKGFTTLLINPASPEKAMLATIIPRPSGTSVFLKVMGTADELKTISSAFSQFAKSLK